MKVVPKFAEGGGFAPFFALYTATETKTPKLEATNNESKKTDNDGELTLKDFFNMFKDIDGLPNEMSSIVDNLIGVFQLSNLTGIDNNNLATTYISNLFRIKLATLNKKKYDEALAVAKKNGSMAEPAITMDGKILVMTPDKKVESVDLETLYNGEKQYMPLSVSNVANMRAYDPTLIGDLESFNIIENSMGFEAFQDLLDKAKITLSSSEYSESGSFLINGAAREGLRSLLRLSKEELLKALASIIANGLYDYTSTGKDNYSLIQELVKYMYTVLPERAKVWASIKTKNPDKEKASLELISNYLMGKRSDSRTFNVLYKGIPKDSNSTTGKDKGTSENDEGFVRQIQSGKGGNDSTFNLISKNTLLFADAKIYGTTKGLELNKSLTKYLADSGISYVVKNNKNITFGDIPIASESFDDIMINSSEGAAVTSLPITIDGKVDFSVMDTYSKVLTQLKDKGLTPNTEEYEKEKANLLKENNLTYLTTPDGNIDTRRFGLFLVINGIASDITRGRQNNKSKSFGEIDSNYIIKSNDDALYEDMLKYLSEDKDSKYDISSRFEIAGLGWGDNLYVGNIYIPLSNNAIDAMNADGTKIDEKSAKEYETRKQIWDKMLNSKSTEYRE